MTYTVGRGGSLIAGRKERQKEAEKMRVLLVQTAFFGDIILSTPVITGLRQLFPHDELYVLTTKAAVPILSRDPRISGVIGFDKRGLHAGVKGFRAMVAELRSYRFDQVYSLHRSFRTALLLYFAGIPIRVGFRSARLSFLYQKRRVRPQAEHDVLRNLALLEGDLAPEMVDNRLQLFAPEASEVSPAIRDLYASEGLRVVVFPGSEWQTKMWHWSGYRRVVEHFSQIGARVFIMGGKEERAVAEKVAGGNAAVVNLAGATTLDEALYMVKNAGLVVCNDSMALHMAAGFDTPVVSIFCATSPRFGFGPWGKRSKVIEREGLLCKPCRRHGSRECPLGTESCMREVRAETVIAAAEDLLSQTVENAFGAA